MLNSGSLGPREKSRQNAVLEEGGMIHHVPSPAQVWHSGCHGVPESCCVLGAESSSEESCDNTSKPFLFSPLWKGVCWQSAGSAFTGSQQLGSEEICNHRLWVVLSTCTCGYFTGWNNCFSWKLAIILNYTHILYSHKHTVKKHRNRTNLSHLPMFCVNSWIIYINLQE